MVALKEIPDITTQCLGSIYFSCLMPGTRLRAHCGPTNARLRMHMGIIVPKAPNSPKIRVGDEIRGWQEGKLFIFDDSFEHEVWNYGELRIALIVDLWHPGLDTPEKRKAAVDKEDEGANFD